MKKNFFLKPDQIRPLTDLPGGAFASDRMVVDGAKVGYMYREAPDHGSDSGWRFLAGDESDEYMDNPANFGIYALNIIANYDTEVLPLLNTPPGNAFVRDPASGRLIVDDVVPGL